MKISVVIQTYNSEQFLERVLNSVKEFDEIVVCDMYSTDRTIEIARKFDCKIVYHKKTDFCEPARNFAIHSATYDWVLVVDSDEIVPADLKDYLYTLLREQRAIGGVWIPRKNYLMGKFIHGDYPDYILRFFRKQNAFWPPYVHAVPRVEGKVIRVPRNKKELAFIHLVNNPLELKLNKLNIYTSKEIPTRTGQKYTFLSIFYAPAYRFFKSYILKGGFRDGKAGVINAGMDAFYKFVTIAKIWENRIKKQDISKELSE